jgi:hypothetical protein
VIILYIHKGYFHGHDRRNNLGGKKQQSKGGIGIGATAQRPWHQKVTIKEDKRLASSQWQQMASALKSNNQKGG